MKKIGSKLTKAWKQLQTRGIHPFKTLQQYLEIEKEWRQLKNNLNSKIFKIAFGGGVLLTAYYSNFLTNQFNKINRYVVNSSVKIITQEDKTKDIQQFLKKLVDDLFNDKTIQQKGGEYVKNLAHQEQVKQAILILLLSAVRDNQFVDEGKKFGKKIADDLLHDKKVQSDVQNLLVNVIKDDEFKYQVLELLKWIVGEEPFKLQIQAQLKRIVEVPEIQSTLSNVGKECFKQLLLDKNTAQQITDFVYFLLKQDGGDAGIQKIIDSIFDKLHNNQKINIDKQSEFEKILLENSSKQASK